MADQPIAVHYQHMEEWLKDRQSVFEKKHKKELKALLEYAPRLLQLVQEIANQEKLIKKTAGMATECEKVTSDAERVAESVEKKRQQFLVDHDLIQSGAPAFDASQLSQLVDSHIHVSIARVTTTLVQFVEKYISLFKPKYDDILRESVKVGGNNDACSLFEQHFPWLSRLLAEHALPLVEDTASVQGNSEDGACVEIDWGDTQENAPVEEPSEIVINWDADDDAVVHAGGAEEEDMPPPANHKTLSINIANGKARSSVLCELEATRCFANERLLFENDTFLNEFVLSVDSVLDVTRASKDAEFVRMKEIYRLRESFEEQVNRFARTIAATQARKRAHETKLSDLHLELSRLEPQREELVKQTRDVRDACVVQLKNMFPDRMVSIVGDINKFL